MEMKTLAAVLFASLACLPAYAGDTGIYSGTTIGGTRVSNPTGANLTKSTDSVFGGFIGYQFNPYFGVEGQYIGLGRFANATQSGKADALDVAAVGFLPLGDRFSLVGKLGVARSFGKSATGGLINVDRTAPMFGVGVQYKVNSSIGVRVGVDHFSAAVQDGATVHNYNSNVFGATFLYNF